MELVSAYNNGNVPDKLFGMAVNYFIVDIAIVALMLIVGLVAVVVVLYFYWMYRQTFVKIKKSVSKMRDTGACQRWGSVQDFLASCNIKNNYYSFKNS